MRRSSCHRGVSVAAGYALLAAVLLAGGGATARGAYPSQSADLLEMLRDLKPLPKVHYSWPVPDKHLTALDPLLYEYARITGAISLRGETATRQQIDAAVSVCSRLNRRSPEIRASLAVHYSPWHRVFPKDMPPTERGRKHIDEMRRMRERLENIAERVAFANSLDKSDVQVSAVIFDCERFIVKADDDAWNDAILSKHEAAADAARLVFPNARLEWYARGAIAAGASKSGWVPNRNFTLREPGTAFACSLYRGPEIGLTRETFRRTVAHADQRGVKEVTPWVALASGYRRTPGTFQKFSFDWNYDLIYSWMLGAELNHPWYARPEQQARFAPWDRARVVIFYPEPFGRSPHWGKHFVAYCRGAARDERLP